MLSTLPILITTTFLTDSLGKLLTQKADAQKHICWVSSSTFIGLGLHLTIPKKTP